VLVAERLDEDDHRRGKWLELVDGQFEAGSGGADYRAGVPPCLEIFVATTLLNWGMPIEPLQQFLGHARLEPGPFNCPV
jgi:hypothetical protein